MGEFPVNSEGTLPIDEPADGQTPESQLPVNPAQTYEAMPDVTRDEANPAPIHEAADTTPSPTRVTDISHTIDHSNDMTTTTPGEEVSSDSGITASSGEKDYIRNKQWAEDLAYAEKHVRDIDIFLGETQHVADSLPPLPERPQDDSYKSYDNEESEKMHQAYQAKKAAYDTAITERVRVVSEFRKAKDEWLRRHDFDGKYFGNDDVRIIERLDSYARGYDKTYSPNREPSPWGKETDDTHTIRGERRYYAAKYAALAEWTVIMQNNPVSPETLKAHGVDIELTPAIMVQIEQEEIPENEYYIDRFTHRVDTAIGLYKFKLDEHTQNPNVNPNPPDLRRELRNALVVDCLNKEALDWCNALYNDPDTTDEQLEASLRKFYEEEAQAARDDVEFDKSIIRLFRGDSKPEPTEIKAA